MTDYEKLCSDLRNELKEQINLLNDSLREKDDFDWKQFSHELESKEVKHNLIDSISGWHHSEILLHLYKEFSFAIIEKKNQSGATVSLISNDNSIKMKIAEICLNSQSIHSLLELLEVGKKVIVNYSENLENEMQKRKEEKEKAAAYSSWMNSRHETRYSEEDEEKYSEDDINYELKKFISNLINRQTLEIKNYIDNKIFNIFNGIANNLRLQVINQEKDSIETMQKFSHKELHLSFLDEKILSDMDSVSKLYSLAKSGYIKEPEYEYSKHEKSWICDCLIGKDIKVSGIADSKKEAKKNAANQAIIAIIKNEKIKVSPEVRIKLQI